MSLIAEFIEQMKRQAAKSDLTATTIDISPSVIELAERLMKWHEKRPAPERWQPIQLGRMAAMFGTSRELMAAALQYAGFKESKTSATSLWTYIK